MTAIIGYTYRQQEDSIGVLCADDLEINSQAKADKLTKISGRFVTAITGLECTDWVIGTLIGYFDQFSGSRIQIETISELESLLNEILPIAFKTLKDAKYFDNIEEQKDIKTQLIVLDLFDNKLYFSELGKIWKIDEEINYKIKLNLLEDGLYSFGVVAVHKDFNKEQYDEFDRNKILAYLKSKIETYRKIFKGYVGNLGSYELNIIGKEKFETFNSCFNSNFELLENIIRRSKQ